MRWHIERVWATPPQSPVHRSLGRDGDTGKAKARPKAAMLAGALLLASAGLLAACGSGVSASTKAPSGPIKIGMITSLSGPYAPLGTNDELGAKQEVSAINAAGGVGGRKIDLILKNDQTNPTQAVVDYQSLVSDGVVGIVGPVFSSSAVALIPDAQKAKIPTIDTAASDSLASPTRYYVFMTPPTTKIVAAQLLAYMKAKGLTKMAVAHDNSSFGTTGWDNMKADAASYGVRFVYDGTFSVTATDFSAILTHVHSSGAQGLMVWGAGTAEVALSQQFHSMGLTIPLVFSHAEASYLYTKYAGAAGYGAIIASSIGGIGPYLPSSYPGRSIITSFVSTFEKANHYYPPEFAFDAGGAVAMLAKAAREGGATPAGIAKALQTMTITTGDGTYHFSATNHSGLSVKQVAITRDVNGTELQPTAFTKSKL